MILSKYIINKTLNNKKLQILIEAQNVQIQYTNTNFC